MDGGRKRESKRAREQETETRVKEVLASGVPPKGLEGRVNFWRYQGFDAGKKGMVRCFVKEYGLMLNRRKFCELLL